MNPIVMLVINGFFKFGFILTWVGATIALLLYAISFIMTPISGSVLGDMALIIQMWLPFNFNVVLAWVVTGLTIYFSYRIAIFALRVVDEVTR